MIRSQNLCDLNDTRFVALEIVRSDGAVAGAKIIPRLNCAFMFRSDDPASLDLDQSGSDARKTLVPRLDDARQFDGLRFPTLVE